MSDRPKYVRLRGLPFSSKEHDVRSFLGGCNVTCVSLPLNHEGRASGEAFVGLKTEDDVVAALAKNKELIQKRYIEVFRLSSEELVNSIRRGFISEEGRLVKLRGLPFSANDREVKEFLSDVDVEEVVFGRNAEGRASGEAFVRLATKDDVRAALQKNKQHMGKRYVEVYEAKVEEMGRARGLPSTARGGPPALRDIASGPMMPLMNGPLMYPMEMEGRSPRGRPQWDDGRGGPQPRMEMDQRMMDRSYPRRGMRPDYDDMYDGGARGGPMRAPPMSGSGYSRVTPYDRSTPYDAPPRPLGGGNGMSGVEDWSSPTKILMRGLPFDVTPHAIERFFAPLRCFEIKLGINEERRPSGDGSVEFGTISEMREALKRHKQTIGSRYIELYPSHEVPPSIRRVRFRVVGGAPAIPPAPLSTPSHRTMPAAPLPTSRPIPPSRYEHEGRPPMQRGYEDEMMGGGYGGATSGERGEERMQRGPSHPMGSGGRNGGGGGSYSSFPSREYGGEERYPQQREYREQPQAAYGRPSPPDYGGYDMKPVKREVYDDDVYGGYDGYTSRRPVPVPVPPPQMHNGAAGDYSYSGQYGRTAPERYY